jgi:uncharacterized protein (TIGR02271 family)
MIDRRTPGRDLRDLAPLSRLADWHIEDKALDLRGHTLHNRSGHPLGRVDELLVDVDQHRVAALRLDGGLVVDIDDVDICDGRALLMTATSPGPAHDVAFRTDDRGSAHVPVAASRPVDRRRDNDRSDDGQRVPIVEEKLEIAKRVTDLRNVAVRTRVVERPVAEDVTLRRERIDIERRPADRSLTAAEAEALLKDQVIEMTERGEEAVVRKSARVVEEVVVTKGVERHTTRVEDTVRHTEVDIDRDGLRDDRTAGRDDRGR